MSYLANSRPIMKHLTELEVDTLLMQNRNIRRTSLVQVVFNIFFVTSSFFAQNVDVSAHFECSKRVLKSCVFTAVICRNIQNFF